MKSPFPGMDPYIEVCQLWGDFSFSLICEIANRLNDRLPEHYAARIGSREYTAICYSEEECIEPTPPHVIAACASAPSSQRPRGEGEPVSMRAFIDEPLRERFVNVYDFSDEQRLVTRVELLSPDNKRPGHVGRESHLRRRRSFLLGHANYVEIDLLRRGDRMPMLAPWPDSPYSILLCRQERAPYCRVWKAYFHSPLPDLTIPLDNSDPDVAFPLQPLVDDIFKRSRYGRRIDYTKPLAPPLTAEQSAWLQGRLRGAAPAEEPATPKRRGGRRK